jgi:hypothetical protein
MFGWRWPEMQRIGHPIVQRSPPEWRGDDIIAYSAYESDGEAGSLV